MRYPLSQEGLSNSYTEIPLRILRAIYWGNMKAINNLAYCFQDILKLIFFFLFFCCLFSFTLHAALWLHYQKNIVTLTTGTKISQVKQLKDILTLWLLRAPTIFLVCLGLGMFPTVLLARKDDTWSYRSKQKQW